MPGLIAEGGAPAAAPPPQQMAAAVQQGIADPSGGPAGTPPPPDAIAAQGGQEVPYEVFFDNISRLIDGEPGLEQIQEGILEMLATGAAQPALALSKATLDVGEMVFQDAQKNGLTITDDMLAAAAMDTLTSLDELATEAGIFEADDEDLQEAFTLVLEGWIQRHPEMIDQEGMKQSLAELDPEMVTEAQEAFGGVQQTPGGAPPPPQAGPAPAPQGGLINA